MAAVCGIRAGLPSCSGVNGLSHSVAPPPTAGSLSPLATSLLLFPGFHHFPLGKPPCRWRWRCCARWAFEERSRAESVQHTWASIPGAPVVHHMLYLCLPACRWLWLLLNVGHVGVAVARWLAVWAPKRTSPAALPAFDGQQSAPMNSLCCICSPWPAMLLLPPSHSPAPPTAGQRGQVCAHHRGRRHLRVHPHQRQALLRVAGRGAEYFRWVDGCDRVGAQ